MAVLALVLAGCATGEEGAAGKESIEEQARQVMLARADVERQVSRTRCRQLMDLATGRRLATQQERLERLLSVEYREEDGLPVKAFFFRGEKPKRIVAVVACQGPDRSTYRLWMKVEASLERQAQVLMLQPPEFENYVGRMNCLRLLDRAKGKSIGGQSTQPDWIAYGSDSDATVGALFRKDKPEQIAAIVACDGRNRGTYRYWTRDNQGEEARARVPARQAAAIEITGNESIEEQARLLMMRPPDTVIPARRQYCKMLMDDAQHNWMSAERTQPLWITQGSAGEITIGALFKKDEPDQVAAVVACDGRYPGTYSFWTR